MMILKSPSVAPDKIQHFRMQSIGQIMGCLDCGLSTTKIVINAVDVTESIVVREPDVMGLGRVFV